MRTPTSVTEVVSYFPGGGGGEANTASNVGTAGVGVFKQKSGVNLEFKKVNAGSTKVTITDDTGTSEVDIDIVPANISHTGIANIGTNTHAQLDSHVVSTSNPHTVTKTQVGLSNVDNTTDLNKPISTTTQSALDLKQPIDADLTAIAALAGTGGYAKRTAADTWSIATPTAADVGADATGTASAAVSAHAAAADPHTGYQRETEKAAVNGYASLGANTIVPTAQLGAGAASSSVFLRGDQTWASPGGGSAVGVLSDLQMSILQTDGTLNAALGVQTWAGTNKTAQDVFTVVANSTYRIRGYWFVNTGATSHTTAMAFALATATVTDFQYQVLTWSAALNTIATAQSTVHASGVASKVMNAASTAVYTLIQFEGIMVIGTGGTVTPQINFSANPTGTNLMKRGSWTSFERLGANTVTVAGGWA